MRMIDLDEFLRQNCVDRMEGKSCDECKHHVLEVSCERLMEQPTAERVGKWILARDGWYCSVCELYPPFNCDPEEKGIPYCPWCGARMVEGEEG